MFKGIDLGGTNIAAGLVDETGKIIRKASTPTLAPRNYQEIVKDMVVLSENLVSQEGLSISDIKAVGIGNPGSVDYENGTIAYANNLDFYNAPIREEFQKYYNLPVVLENDANAAAYGEYMINGDNCGIFIAITLGTGVGGGIILDGNIFRGSNGAGAELGHFTLVHNGLPCTCGKKGCWESYASATALISQTKVAMAKHPESIMHSIAKDHGSVNGRTAFDAAKQGDGPALEVVKKYIEYVADGLVSVANIFQPDKIVIGGGISKEKDYLLNPIREYVNKYDYNKLFKKVDIEIATLYNDAGIIGAALTAKNFK